MINVYWLFLILNEVSLAEETTLLGAQLLDQIESETSKFDLAECQRDIGQVYAKLPSVYEVELSEQPFLIETFSNWEFGYRIAVPLIFSTNTEAYSSYVADVAQTLSKYSSPKSLMSLPADLNQRSYDEVLIPTSSHVGKAPLYLVTATGTVQQYLIPYECFALSANLYIDEDEGYIEYYDRALFHMGAQFQMLGSTGKGISGQFTLEGSRYFETQEQFYTYQDYDSQAVTDFRVDGYVGQLPVNRSNPRILVDTGYDETIHSDYSEEWIDRVAASSLVIRPGFFTEKQNGQFADSVSSVLYFTLEDNTKVMMSTIDRVMVRFFAPGLSSNSRKPTDISATKEVLSTKLLQKSDANYYQIAIGQTLDPSEAIAVAQRVAVASFIEDKLPLGLFISSAQRSRLIDSVVFSIEQYIEDASLDLYMESPLATNPDDNWVFVANVRVKEEQVLQQILQDTPTSVEVNLSPLVERYQQKIDTRNQCESALRSIYQLVPEFWKIRQVGDIQVAEKNTEKVTLTIPLQLFVDHASFTNFKSSIEAIMSENSYSMSSNKIQVSSRHGVPWVQNQGHTRWYLASNALIQNGSVSVQQYDLPCMLSESDMETVIDTVVRNNIVSLQLLNSDGETLVSAKFDIGDEYVSDYHNISFQSSDRDQNDRVYPLVAPQIIGPWFYTVSDRYGYYSEQVMPSDAFRQSIDKEIVLVLNKELLKQVASIKTDFQLYQLNF